MVNLKVTFSLDETTVARLNQTARTLGKAKSEVVREAIADYSERNGRLGEAERRRMLAAFDRLVPEVPNRPIAEVEEEIASVRLARRHGGRGDSEPDAS